jgi:hypothetical protein
MSARRPGGAAATTPAKRRPWATVDLVAAGHGQPPHHRIPSGPMQAGDHRPRTPGAPGPAAPSRRPPHPATPGPARRGPRGGIAADSAGLSVRTPEHRTPGHRTLDAWTPDAWTLDAWTLDVRSTGWTDVPRRDRGRGQGNDQPGRRPDIPAPATPAGRPELTRVTAPGGAGPPRTAPRRRHLCWALTAAATDSCLAPPGGTPLEAARAPAHCCPET